MNIVSKMAGGFGPWKAVLFVLGLWGSIYFVKMLVPLFPPLRIFFPAVALRQPLALPLPPPTPSISRGTMPSCRHAVSPGDRAYGCSQQGGTVLSELPPETEPRRPSLRVPSFQGACKVCPT